MPPISMSPRAGADDDEADAEEPAEEAEEVLRERGRVGRRWMRWLAEGQRGRAEVGGLEVGVVLRLELVLLLRLRVAGERAARPGLVAGLGKLLREE
jgi:hypothetical protein